MKNTRRIQLHTRVLTAGVMLTWYCLIVSRPKTSEFFLGFNAMGG